MNFDSLQTFLNFNNQPKYRYNQIVSEILLGHAVSYQDLFTIPQSLRTELEKEIPLISLQPEKVLKSKDKKTYKALLKLSDGNFIETVLLSPKPSLWSVCLSCQIGCQMNCSFCATGKMGFVRNLTSEEITDQILFWRQHIANKKLKIRIQNIIYMGMGEPLANTEIVFDSINNFINPNLFGFGSRHLSVSTCGLPSEIKKFADTFSQVNLAISLHAGSQALREKLMPIAKQFPLDQLFDSIHYYLEKTNRKVFFEYILISNENDSDKQALELANLLSNNFSDKLHIIHVNLINFNPIKTDTKATTKDRIKKFQRILENFKISTTIRKSLGQDIAGACGQLYTKKASS
jgi:23S rRNA (adenine2503-C2)-methyltransferase